MPEPKQPDPLTPPEGDPPAKQPDPPKPPEGQDVSSLPEWARASLSKSNAEAAKYRTQVRELEPLAQKAKDADEASKTEVQHAADAKTAAEQRAEKAESELLRINVGLTKGLTAAQTKRLVGSTQEELETDADAFLTEVGDTPRRTSSLPRRPGEAPPAGTAPGATDAGPDMNSLIRRQLGRT